MASSLNYEMIRSAAYLIASEGRIGHLDNIGLSVDDFNKVCSDTPWLASDRNRVTSALSILLNAPLDAVGQSRFILPAEYVACAISMFCRGGNIKLACRWIECPAPATDLIKGKDQPERCTADQLFAMILDFHGSNPWSEARQMFEKNTKLKLDLLAKEGSDENTQKQTQKGK